jgi:hypothetical protein
LSSARKHHYVPAFLLEQWHSGSDNRLTRFGWEHGKFMNKRRSARLCARRHGLYSLKGVTRPDIIESLLLGSVDSNGAKVHQRLLAMTSAEYSPFERQSWAQFLTALMRRHPEFISSLRTRAEQAYHDAVKDYREEKGGTLPQEFEDWLSLVGTDDAKNAGLLRIFPDLVASEPVNSAILNARWKVRRHAPTDIDLLISDRPVIYIGALNKTFLLALPLSPHHIFFAFNDPRTGDKLDAVPPRRMIKLANFSTLETVGAHVFATSDRQIEYVKKRLTAKE